MGKHKSKKNYPLERLLKRVSPLVRHLRELQNQAKLLGVFTNDRNLLECKCGLIEDVASNGKLFTWLRTSLIHEDTGLRFEEMDSNHFQCPRCKRVIEIWPARYLLHPLYLESGSVGIPAFCWK